MLRSAAELQSYSIYAVDADLGSVEAFVVVDEAWQVWYLLVKTGGLLGNRKVRIAPEFIKGADQDMQVLYTNLTKEQVKSSPDVEMDHSVADQQEFAYYDYYRANPYWGSSGQPTGLAGVSAYPAVSPSTNVSATSTLGGQTVCEEDRGNLHLRSTEEVEGCRIEATDGEIGHVEDFVIDEEHWAIRYIVIDTGKLLPGKKVLISPRWVAQVRWLEREVHVDLTRDEIKSAPKWKMNAAHHWEYAPRLHEPYVSPPYWAYR